ncbi:hypothetical protein LEP1GSC079_3740 [Leptospira interrogans str. FPW1039]|uniref:SLEI domain protein, PF07620 family n=1 Tax=Leptospira interrogans str. FPW1039 TaxID=1193040 RepID=A0A0F6IDP7_LEPIR|nr:hypothetical protein LEP1GSC045_1666 [Leptospira interrogans serovar Pomona str. Kennewicki LC82-25]EKN99330.1 hypothetical protein LEP1GSC014_0601 [Leptospira interrogans serovar Pomona str. Pomona]EKO70893.1 hypothetical protein LEP1GSC069_2451 [Leptospira interrogans serovar Canicola str. Fiocruz LV133]EKO86060.1 hypothetical protein LEP1GSC009_0661 [Leptospira interrogans serovar Grippotyphosa str. Andaman]EKR37249.1 hypothetical protein LEP1GSC096_1797 [Leptospira interrogans serovar He
MITLSVCYSRIIVCSFILEFAPKPQKILHNGSLEIFNKMQ